MKTGESVYRQVEQAIPKKFEGRSFLLVDDISKYLEIHPRTVHAMIARKQIKAYKIGKEFRIPIEALIVYLSSASVES